MGSGIWWLKRLLTLWSHAARCDRVPMNAQDFAQRTTSGGVITVAASVVMVVLFMSELRELAGRRPLPGG